MKKKVTVGIVIVVIIGIFIFSRMNERTNENPASNNSNNSGLNVQMGINFNNEGSSEIQVSDKGIIYTGKVVPEAIYYYSKDMSMSFNKNFVSEGQKVKKGDVLFDYTGADILLQQNIVLQNNFTTMKEKQDDLYARLAANNSYLEMENRLENGGDEGYKAYLNREIQSLEAQIAQSKSDWLANEQLINNNKQSVQEHKVKAEVDGLVYQINDSNAVAPGDMTKTAYMVVYTETRMIRIEVSEFEYTLVYEGMEVEVEIESLKKTYTGLIQFVDSMPNNLESSDTSFYYVEIAVPSEIPYGYSAIVTVPNHE